MKNEITYLNENCCGFLTRSCLEISLTSVFWTCDTFKKYFGVKHKFAKCFEESFKDSIQKNISPLNIPWKIREI